MAPDLIRDQRPDNMVGAGLQMSSGCAFKAMLDIQRLAPISLSGLLALFYKRVRLWKQAFDYVIWSLVSGFYKKALVTRSSAFSIDY